MHYVTFCNNVVHSMTRCHPTSRRSVNLYNLNKYSRSYPGKFINLYKPDNLSLHVGLRAPVHLCVCIRASFFGQVLSNGNLITRVITFIYRLVNIKSRYSYINWGLLWKGVRLTVLQLLKKISFFEHVSDLNWNPRSYLEYSAWLSQGNQLAHMANIFVKFL
jgi:hypothetical protein